MAFALRGIEGRVSVTYSVNDRPDLVGAAPQSAGFPMCDATVDYAARGYDSLLGWVQLVRSDDNVSGGREFEIDPLEALGDLPHPFCWLGLNPRLFDAPSRSPRADLDWLAHSFLCVPDGGGDASLEAQALLGFSWGFRIRDEVIALVPPVPLEPSAWDHDAALLAPLYPGWRFVEGFRAD